MFLQFTELGVLSEQFFADIFKRWIWGVGYDEDMSAVDHVKV